MKTTKKTVSATIFAGLLKVRSVPEADIVKINFVNQPNTGQSVLSHIRTIYSFSWRSTVTRIIGNFLGLYVPITVVLTGG